MEHRRRDGGRYHGLEGERWNIRKGGTDAKAME